MIDWVVPFFKVQLRLLFLYDSDFSKVDIYLNAI